MASRTDADLEDTIGATEAGIELPRAHELPLGSLFAGRYVVEQAIGRGGMGAVYRVRDQKLDEVVALKLLTLATDKAIERFRSEVKLARRVTHPNVARTHDLGEVGGVHYLTMEHVLGRSLDDVLQEQERLTPERALDVAQQIAAGLEAAHGAGVVHRDLKPANVMIAEDGRAVITDFGIARSARDDAARTNDLVGTPMYMSPEQVSGRPVDARSDLYTVGVILYELVTGEAPFAGDSAVAIALARLQQAAPDPRRLDSSIPTPLAELVLRLLAREPEARLASATELRAALDAIHHGKRPVTPSTPTGSSLFAPISPGARALAVLPMRYRGPADLDYLGESLAEELVDVLSRTRGLKVLSLGATSRFKDERDPVRIANELAAEAIVDGTVQLAGSRVRIAARLVDRAGVQQWTETFDAPFADVFALQESMGRRIAEALRLELDASAHGRTAPHEAVELYVRGRKSFRAELLTGAEEAVGYFTRCLELAPDFTLARAALAMASVRAWWGGGPAQQQARAERAVLAVQRAVEAAPDLAETHLARAMLATQHGEFAEAARSLSRALEIAPTMADAHQYLGELQCEAGRATEGRKRLRLALELDPTSNVSRISLARQAALAGDYAESGRLLAEVGERLGRVDLPLLTGLLRYAVWEGDHARRREIQSSFGRDLALYLPFLRLLSLLDAETTIETIESERLVLREQIKNPRLRSLIGQMTVEIYSVAGYPEHALRILDEVSSAILIDVEWMERCPAIASLRGSPTYTESLARVRARAAAIWAR